jgi:hypothetical protein
MPVIGAHHIVWEDNMGISQRSRLVDLVTGTYAATAFGMNFAKL